MSVGWRLFGSFDAAVEKMLVVVSEPPTGVELDTVLSVVTKAGRLVVVVVVAVGVWIASLLLSRLSVRVARRPTNFKGEEILTLEPLGVTVGTFADERGINMMPFFSPAAV